MSKAVRYLLAGCLVAVLMLGAFSVGAVAGWFGHDRLANAPDNPIFAGTDVTERPEAQSQDIDDLFAPFWEAWDIVHQNYVDQPVDELALMRGAIRGMLDALGDQHSGYMNPDEYRQANEPMDGEYEGIGAYVDTGGDYLVVTSPIPGSPAEAAGLRPGDMIIKVDGEDMTGVAGDLVLKRVLGPAGSKVTLTVVREGEEQPFDVTITRAKIELKSVNSKMLDDGIAYVQITTFGEKTTRELKLALRELMAQNPQGMVLDLRFNGGGYLNTAIDVISEFIPAGQIVMYEEYGDGTRDTYKAQRGGLATKIPLVVLVNEGSASASEITAGAIQDLGRGQLVGVTTYGKGSVQNWIPLRRDGGAVRITVARWLTPNERQIHEVGLTPDVVVEMTEEDYEAERDPQLDKAVELLKEAK